MRGGVSFVAFLSVLVDAIFSLACAMSAAASATTHVCQTPDPRDNHARRIIGTTGYTRFALIRAEGAALDAKTRPIEKNRD